MFYDLNLNYLQSRLNFDYHLAILRNVDREKSWFYLVELKLNSGDIGDKTTVADLMMFFLVFGDSFDTVYIFFFHVVNVPRD